MKPAIRPVVPLAALAAALLLVPRGTDLRAQEPVRGCYVLRIVPVEGAAGLVARAAEVLAGPVALTRDPAGRPSAPDAHTFYRAERPGPRHPRRPRGFTVWTEAPDGTLWLGGAAVPTPSGERAASARLHEHEDGVLRGRLEVARETPSEDGAGGRGATVGWVTAPPVACDPPAVVLGRAEP